MKIYFISKDASWQKYRLDVLTKLATIYHHDIEILTNGKTKHYLTDNEHVKYKSFKSLIPKKLKASFMPGIIWHIVKNKPDAVLALNNATQITEYIAFIMCKIMRVKFIWWTHGYDHKKNSNTILFKLKEKFVLFFLRRSNAVITFSEKGREYLISKKLNSEKIITAHNTLNTEDILEIKNSFSDQRSTIKKEFGFMDSDKIIIFTGRLTKEKKIDHAILACEKLQNSFPNLNLVIVGDGTEMMPLKDLSVKINLKNIRFLGEIYDENVLAKWLLIADLCVMPAYVGLGIIHAFCYDLPIITEEDINHGPEIQYLKDGINGYLVRNNNIDELSQRIQELITNNEKLNIFSKAAFNTVEEEGNINSMVKNMNKALTIH